MKLKQRLCILGLVWLSAGSAFSASDNFKSLLGESSMAFEMPLGWLPAKRSYSDISSDHVLVTPGGGTELHLFIRPIGRMNIDYDDPHSSAPKPNEVFPLLFDSMIQKFAGHGGVNRAEFSADQSIEMFQANWAAAATFDLKDNLSELYQEGLLVAIHRHDFGDAYLLFVSRSLDESREFIQAAQTALQYSAP